MRLLVSVISPKKVDLIRLSRPTFSWILNSLANSEMRRVVWGSWFSGKRGLRQCLLTLSLDRSNWQGRLQPLHQVSSQGQLTLGSGWMSGSNTLKQISFQSLSPQTIRCAVSSNIIERESTPLPASTLRQLRKQKWVKLASRVLNFSCSARKVASLLNSAASMQRAHIVPTENSSAFLRHSLTASTSTSPKERYFNDPSRYFSSDSLYSTLPRSYPERSLRKACSVQRKPMPSYEYTCFRIQSRQSRRPAKVSRFYLKRSTEEERLANYMPHGEELAAGSRREVALVIRGELFGLGGIDVLFPIAYFCIINQLHSWGRFITEPQEGQAVGTFIVQRRAQGEGESQREGVDVELACFSILLQVSGISQMENTCTPNNSSCQQLWNLFLSPSTNTDPINPLILRNEFPPNVSLPTCGLSTLFDCWQSSHFLTEFCMALMKYILQVHTIVESKLTNIKLFTRTSKNDRPKCAHSQGKASRGRSHELEQF